jgi:hypothetical protein
MIFADTNQIQAYEALTAPSANLLAQSGGGTAVPGDISYVDSNPATMALLGHQYTFTGGAGFGSPTGYEQFEVGVFDYKTTEIATGLRFRQIASLAGHRDQRLTLGGGGLFPGHEQLSLGASLDYTRVQDTTPLGDFSGNLSARFGAGYVTKLFRQNFIFGLSSGGYNNKHSQKQHAVGVSTPLFENYYILNADVQWEAKGITAYIGGVSVSTEYFDIRTSFGHNPTYKKWFGGGGFFFKSPLLRVYYTVAKPNSRGTTLRQNVGMDIMIAM